MNFNEMSEAKKNGSFNVMKFNNFMLSLVFFSPMIIPISLCAISISQQNVNCLFYLFTLYNQDLEYKYNLDKLEI
jgi:hypothetical protein